MLVVIKANIPEHPALHSAEPFTYTSLGLQNDPIKQVLL